MRIKYITYKEAVLKDSLFNEERRDYLHPDIHAGKTAEYGYTEGYDQNSRNGHPDSDFGKIFYTKITG